MGWRPVLSRWSLLWAQVHGEGGCAVCFLGSVAQGWANAAVGTALCIGSANTWNQIIEVERDRRMLRTENRPLPRMMGWAGKCFFVAV